MVTAVVLFSLFALVAYFYVADTTRNLVHSIKATGRMVLVIVLAVAVFIFMIFSLVKYGTIP